MFPRATHTFRPHIYLLWLPNHCNHGKLLVIFDIEVFSLQWSVVVLQSTVNQIIRKLAWNAFSEKKCIPSRHDDVTMPWWPVTLSKLVVEHVMRKRCQSGLLGCETLPNKWVTRWWNGTVHKGTCKLLSGSNHQLPNLFASYFVSDWWERNKYKNVTRIFAAICSMQLRRDFAV